MILETMGRDRDGVDFHGYLDDIKEVHITEQGINILRNDSSRNYHLFDAYDNEKVYLLNNEGKKLTKLQSIENSEG